MGTQKTPIQKTYEINVGKIPWKLTFWGQTGNLTGQNYPLSTTKVTNTPQSTTVTTLK